MSYPERCLGLDGKSYPTGRLSAEDRAYLVGRVHYLRHDERLSVRQIVARVADEHGVRRSVGWMASVLSDWRCDHCSGVPTASPEQQEEGGA